MGKDKAAKRVMVASVGHLLHRAAQRALDLYVAEAGPGAITQRQHAVLAAVADHEGAAQADLVTATGVDRSTLADMVSRMIDKGLLARERSTLDARANAVRLTDAGRTALAALRGSGLFRRFVCTRALNAEPMWLVAMMQSRGRIRRGQALTEAKQEVEARPFLQVHGS
jgi:DNA-binding MarR family transcriptional regulator